MNLRLNISRADPVDITLSTRSDRPIPGDEHIACDLEDGVGVLVMVMLMLRS